MSNTEDRNDETINLDLDEHTSAEDADMDVNTEANANADDDFDYLKEIEEIEAQEKELEEQRQKKKEELERRREEREKDDKKSAAQRKREMKERKKEAEWLGEPFEDDVEIVPTAKKKKSKKGLVAIVVIVLIALAGGAAFAYKMQADKKELADFSQKVAAFQSEKLDGRDFGSHQSYFTDFMKECQDAIDAGDLKKMEDLDKKWSEVENTYTTVSNGKTSLDAFASGIDQALSTYSITDDYKATYETLKKDVEAAQKDCDYEKVSDFQKQLDALATNLKSDNLKVIQNLKNDISSVSLDKDYVSADDQKKLDAYSTEVEKYIKEENYAQAVTTLNSWKTDVTALKKTIDDKKAAEQAKAESEAESKRAAAGFALTIAPINVWKLSANCSSVKEAVPTGTWIMFVLSSLYSILPALISLTAFVTSIVTVPAFGFGIKPLGPSTRPRRPTTPIISGVATTTSKSSHPSFWIFGTSSCPPTKSAPAA